MLLLKPLKNGYIKIKKSAPQLKDWKKNITGINEYIINDGPKL